MDLNTVVPFEIININHGFQKASGLLKLQNDHLLFEFQLTDTIIEMFKSDVEEIKIPLSEIREINYKKILFSTKIVITANSLKIFEQIPGTDNAECVLRVKRKYRDDARNLVSKVRLRLSEIKLRNLEDEDEGV